MSRFRQYELVRVVRLLRAPDHYDGWRLNQRAPAVGDVGCVVEILEQVGLPKNYVVESSGEDGVTVWLSDFAAEELAPIGVSAV